MQPVGSEREEGQTLVLFALVVIVLLSFTALALDGGLTYTKRRAVQNTADAAAVRGAYTLLRQRESGSVNQETILAAMAETLPLNGLVDPEAPGRLRMLVYFTDDNGNRIGAREVEADGPAGVGLDDFLPELPVAGYCQVGGCDGDVAGDAMGVEVVITHAFDSYLAGFVGWEEITVSADASAVSRGSAPPQENLWAIFANAGSCTGDAIHLSGSEIQINGHIHSNADVHMHGSDTEVAGNISFVGNCNSSEDGSRCTATGTASQIAPIQNLRLPAYEEFRALADSQTLLGNGRRYFGDLTIDRRRPATLGTLDNPFTYVDGDLTLASNGTATLHGLIVVTGDVSMAGRAVNSDLFSLVVGGEIHVTQTAEGFSGEPYSTADAIYGKLLMENPVKLLADSGGSPACNNNSIKMSANHHVLRGAFIAPNGAIEISGSSTEVVGTLIGNTVKVTGSSTTITYGASYFPDQYSRLELVD